MLARVAVLVLALSAGCGRTTSAPTCSGAGRAVATCPTSAQGACRLHGSGELCLPELPQFHGCYDADPICSHPFETGEAPAVWGEYVCVSVSSRSDTIELLASLPRCEP